MASCYADYRKYYDAFKQMPYYIYTSSISANGRYNPKRYDFIPLIKWMPNLCKWLGLGKVVRRNVRRQRSGWR